MVLVLTVFCALSANVSKASPAKGHRSAAPAAAHTKATHSAVPAAKTRSRKAQASDEAPASKGVIAKARSRKAQTDEDTPVAKAATGKARSRKAQADEDVPVAKAASAKTRSRKAQADEDAPVAKAATGKARSRKAQADDELPATTRSTRGRGSSRRSRLADSRAPEEMRRSRHGMRRERSNAPAGDVNLPAAQTVSLSRTRIPMMPPLRGSYDSLVRQNVKTEDDGLERIVDDEDLNDRIARKMLVPVPASSALTVNGSLPENRRYCRPWTALFLSDLARAHATQFRRPLYVSSAVRTIAFQKQLMQTNGNAASAEGDVASPHLTGATIDIAKQGLSNQELSWMRSHLLALQEAGKIDVEEEFRQSCFHITVYKSYAPLLPAQKADAPSVGKPETSADLAPR
jgi:hypothetical protein